MINSCLIASPSPDWGKGLKLEALYEAKQLHPHVPPEADVAAAALVTIVTWCLVVIP